MQSEQSTSGQQEIGLTPPQPYKVKLVCEMTSDELVAFVENRQKKRLSIQLAAHKVRKADAQLDAPAVISRRLETAHEKLQKALDAYTKNEEKLTKALSDVVALRSQLGLEDLRA